MISQTTVKIPVALSLPEGERLRAKMGLDRLILGRDAAPNEPVSREHTEAARRLNSGRKIEIELGFDESGELYLIAVHGLKAPPAQGADL